MRSAATSSFAGVRSVVATRSAINATPFWCGSELGLAGFDSRPMLIYFQDLTGIVVLRAGNAYPQSSDDWQLLNDPLNPSTHRPRGMLIMDGKLLIAYTGNGLCFAWTKL